MHAKSLLVAAIAGMLLCVASTGWTDVPAPPVNQIIGMPDVLAGEFTEDDCRVCHDSGLPDRHHLLYDTPIPPGSQVPYPDADGDGIPDTTYGCLNCHELSGDDPSFTPVTDCVVCHTSSAHHRTPAAVNGDCVSCHGDIVDNIGDGHYIPTYEPSEVTPSSSCGNGLPLNSRGKGAGACDYCHDDDGLEMPIIRNNADLHHATTDAWNGALDCLVCHEIQDPLNIRVCEGCHGPDSLHNIQVDSDGNGVVIGGELAGYGHVGRDAGPGDSDCWGCHGFAFTSMAVSASAPLSGPIIPTVYCSDVASISAGSDALVMLTGACFTNTMDTMLYESDVALTAADGSSVVLAPEIILDEGTLVFTIPGDTAPGNYNVQAVKDQFASNPAVISIVPAVTIEQATVGRRITITGSGFGGYLQGSGTTVVGTITTNVGTRVRQRTLEAAVVSWTDTKIIAMMPTIPSKVTVHSVFGSASSDTTGRGITR